MDINVIVANEDAAQKNVQKHSANSACDGSPTHIETIVIGGGQAGLIAGFYLLKAKKSFAILDANARTGDAWRTRWDSLKLFTPARFNGLPGMRCPAKGDAFVSKDDMADFLEVYANRFQLPITHKSRVTRLTRQGDRYVVETSQKVYTADNVIVAMANYQKPRVPEFATKLRADVTQLHSSEYQNPDQLQQGSTLVVGGGNSAADIALELSATRTTWMSGKETGHIPFRIEGLFGRKVGIRMVRFLGHRILNTSTPFGRKFRPEFLAHAGPLVRVKPQDLLDAGVKWIGRTVGVRDGLPLVEEHDGPLEVANVVWCTGFKPGFDWIDLPIFNDSGYPNHTRGLVSGLEGLGFIGLGFQYAATSSVITGVARDARYVIASLTRRRSATSDHVVK